MEAKSIERIAEELGVSFYALQPYILMREEISFKAGKQAGEQQGIKLVVEEIALLLGIKNNFGVLSVTRYCSWDEWQAFKERLEK